MRTKQFAPPTLTPDTRMQPPAAELAEWRAHHAQLTACLAGPSWISEGSAQDRGPGVGGPCDQWTRKVRARR